MRKSEFFHRYCNDISIGLSITIFGMTLSYAIAVSSGIPLEDEWRWVRDLLIPFRQKGINLSEYFLGEYNFISHSHFPALGVLLLSSYVFELSFLPYVFIGLLSYTILFFLLVRQMTDGGLPNKEAGCWLLASLVAFCTITSDFPWLLVVFEYSYLLLAFFVLIACDKYIKDEISGVLYFIVIAFAVFFSDAIGFTAVLTVLGIGALAVLLDKTNWKKFFSQTCIIALVLAIKFFAFGRGDVGTGKAGSLFHSQAPLDSFGILLQSLLNVFSQAFLDNTILIHIFGAEDAGTIRIILGILGLLLVLGSIFIFFYNHLYNKTFMPVLLIGYCFVNWLGILLIRVPDFGSEVVCAQRYTRLFVMALIGVFWVGLLLSRKKSPWMKVGPWAAGIMLIFYVISANYQFFSLKYVNDYFDGASTSIQSFSEQGNAKNLGAYIGFCSNGECDSILEYMLINKTGFFTE